MDIKNLAEEIVKGRRITRQDNLSFFKDCNLDQLCEGADYIRKNLVGNHVDLCTIINGKSGKCSENCKFCAQSAVNHTDCEVYNFLDDEIIFKRAASDESEGVHRFSIVTSGKALSGNDFEKALISYKKMHEKLKINLCASMGFVTKEQLLLLKAAGVTSYHHNIETSERNFPNICTSHTYAMKIATLKMVKECGLRACSGGIIGMGETFEDRTDMAVSLSELYIDSIPINVLMPIPGTPMENNKALTEDEVLRTIAMFRFINPKSDIRLAAGRKNMTGYGTKAFKSGANSTITGNMLTTTGTTIKEDIQMFKNMGMEV